MQQIFKLVLLVIALSVNIQVMAEPYIAYKNNLKCGTCHVNPNGGGLRTSFGNLYGHAMLPVEPLKLTSADVGKINDYLQLGGNFRSNLEYSKDENKVNSENASFRIDSAQLYLALNAKELGVTFYLDQQIAPGAAVNREAFAMYKFSNNHYIKMGKMYTPFGIRLEDDSAYVRQATGFNFDSSDNGIELGLDYTQSTVNLFISNGTSSVSNDDNKFLYGVRGEHQFANARVGSTLVLNDSDSSQQKIVNVYGAYTFADFTLLAEWDWILTKQSNGQDRTQLVGLFEVNYQWRQGLNFKLTSEYYDPNKDIDENQETRFSFVTEYTPISHLQLRAGIRVAESIPQFEQRNNDKLFLQTHFYF